MSTTDADVEEFLQSLKPGTRKIYKTGLDHFQEFYKTQGTAKDFLDRVEEDLGKPRRERKRVAFNTLREFMQSLQPKFAPKSVRAYVGSVQSFAAYFEIPVTLRKLGLPGPLAKTKKYPWTLEAVDKFINLFSEPIYKATAAIFFQSGLGPGDTLALTYGDIKQEYEANISPLCLDLARIKTETPFMTFLGNWGINILRTYLQNKQLQPTEPLFPIGEEAIEDYFRHAASKFIGPYENRNPAGPYSLRAGFRTLLGDQRVDPLYIEFWMGHSAPEQQKVYVSKSREGWRQTYKQLAEPYLTPRSTAIPLGTPENPF